MHSHTCIAFFFISFHKILAKIYLFEWFFYWNLWEFHRLYLHLMLLNESFWWPLKCFFEGIVYSTSWACLQAFISTQQYSLLNLKVLLDYWYLLIDTVTETYDFLEPLNPNRKINFESESVPVFGDYWVPIHCGTPRILSIKPSEDHS